VGGTLGLSAALSSLTRVVAPTVGGFLPGRVGAPAPGVLGALLTAWLVYRRLHDPNVQRGDGHLQGDRHLTDGARQG
jgi:hypothetical protein